MEFATGRIRVPRIKTEDYHDTEDIIVPMVPGRWFLVPLSPYITISTLLGILVSAVLRA
jgi:hypothetical protein